MAEEIAAAQAADPDFDLNAVFSKAGAELQQIDAAEDFAEIETLGANLSENGLRIEGEVAILSFDGREALRFGKKRISNKETAVFLRTVILIIDVIFFMVALMGVGMKASKKFAQKIANKMTKSRKKWLKLGKKTLTHLKKVIGLYEKFKKQNAGERSSSKRQKNLLALLKGAKKEVSGGFKAVIKMLFNEAWSFVKTTIQEYLKDWKRAAQLLLSLTAKILAWIGTAGVALAAAIVDALSKAITVLQDIDALKAAQKA